MDLKFALSQDRRVSFSLFFLLWVLTSKIDALEVGDTAPNFSLPSLTKNVESSLEDSAGFVIYLDFWASWCSPCRLSMPALEKLYEEFASEGFHVVAINVDEIREDALDFLEDFPVSYSILADPEGTISQLYNVVGMPSGYLINRQGKIMHSHIGFRRGDEEVLRRMIRSVLER